MAKEIEKYNVTYSCGCVHELAKMDDSFFHQATGNNKDCELHKNKEE